MSIFPYDINKYRTLDPFERLLQDMRNTQDIDKRRNMLIDYTTNELKKELGNRNEEIEGFGNFVKQNIETHTGIVPKFNASFEEKYGKIVYMHPGKYISYTPNSPQETAFKQTNELFTGFNSSFPVALYSANLPISTPDQITKDNIKDIIEETKKLFKEPSNHPVLTKFQKPFFEVVNELYPLPTKTVYKISNFKSQADILQNTRRIIFPYTVKSGNAHPIPEREFQIKYPEEFSVMMINLVREISRNLIQVGNMLVDLTADVGHKTG